MLSVMRLQFPNPTKQFFVSHSSFIFKPTRTFQCVNLIKSCRHTFLTISLANDDSSPATHTSSIGSPQLNIPTQWNVTGRHVLLLNVAACTVAMSASWLFLCAIPTLLAFKRAAESLEKLLDVTREELPDTMAAIRLSGMEISDLTMDLSDLGHEITQGVRSSTRVARMAGDRFRRLTNTTPKAFLQEHLDLNTESGGPIIARTARSLRENIVNSRAILRAIISITGFFKWIVSFFTSRQQKR